MDVHSVIQHVTSTLGLSLKDKQEEALYNFLCGRDVFVSLPTGYGKSIIYAILPLAFNLLRGIHGSIVICVSPLTSLMMDQHDKYEKFAKGQYNVNFVGEEQADKEVIKRVLIGDIHLLYITPESLISNPTYRNMLLSTTYQEKMAALVIDEAHCVKSWGDQFRTAFAHLGELRSVLPSRVNVLALTATASTATFQAVCERLSVVNPVLIGTSPDRPNIFFSVKPLPTMKEFCEHIAERIKNLGSCYPKTIIYCRNYSDCGNLYHQFKITLDKHFTSPPGYPDLHIFRTVEMYSRAAKSEMREQILSSICDKSSKLRIVIATSAFGMGIDCPDIREVFHWGPPASLETYAQETGRAGRDSLPSTACLLYGKPGQFVDDEVKEYASNSISCRRNFLFKFFLFSCNSSSSASGCMCCDLCTINCSCQKCYLHV